MNSNTLLKSLTLAILCVSIGASQADADIVTLLDLSGRDAAGLGTGESGGNFVSPKTFDSISDLSLSDVPWSDGAFSGVIDISLDASATGTPTVTLEADPIGRGGKGAFGLRTVGEGNSFRAVLEPDEGAITLSNIQYSYVSGDAISNIAAIQFAGVYIGNMTIASESGTINGAPIVNADTGGDTTAGGQNVLSAFADSAVIEATAGTFSINGVDLAVSAIPEPSSLSLWGLGVVAFALIRRRQRG